MSVNVGLHVGMLVYVFVLSREDARSQIISFDLTFLAQPDPVFRNTGIQ